MVYQPNQVADKFKEQLMRPPTDYELKKYSTASPQVLANLKGVYGKLNTNSSISDYLTSQGQDPSLQNRVTLEQKFGITNIGTAERNTALLNALKSGAPQEKKVEGSIAPQVDVTIDQQNAIDQQKIQEQQNKQQDEQQKIDGTILKATGEQPVVTPTIETDESVKASKQAETENLQLYQSTQKQVADIDTQIASLRQTIAGAIKDKEAQAAASGGVVSRAQIASEVSTQTGAIQQQINNLLQQRAPLATAQSQASQNLQQARNDRKDAEANFYKNLTTQQAQQRIENQAKQFETKTDIQGQQFTEKQQQQQQQFTQKLEQSGWKSIKTNQYDEYGNVIGQKNVWTQNPSDKTGFDETGKVVSVSGNPKATSSSIDLINNAGGIKWTGSQWQKDLGMTDSGIKAKDGGTFALPPSIEAGNQAQKKLFTSKLYADLTINDALKKWSNNGYGSEIVKDIPANTKVKDLTPAQLDEVMANQKAREGYGAKTSGTDVSIPKVPMHTDNTIDIKTPGYTTAHVIFNGKDTQTTQSYIDIQAINAIMGGKSSVGSGGRGVKTPAFYANEAINERIGQLDPGGNLVLNKAKAQAWGSNLTKQINYASNLDRSLKSADADLQQVLKTYKDKGINDSQTPISNIINNATQYHLGNGDVSAFKASLAEISRLYAQVFSTGGSVQGTNVTAQDIIDGNISLENLQKVTDQLQKLGQIDVDKAYEAVKNTETQIGDLAPGKTKEEAKTVQSNGQTYNIGQVYNDGTANWVVDSQGNWSKQ